MDAIVGHTFVAGPSWLLFVVQRNAIKTHGTDFTVHVDDAAHLRHCGGHPLGGNLDVIDNAPRWAFTDTELSLGACETRKCSLSPWRKGRNAPWQRE